MTPVATASAPGKLFLSGEYAVLHGGLAVGMAVDRRAVVEVSKAAGDWNTLTVQGFDCTAQAFRLERDGSVQWRDPDAANTFDLIDAVLDLPQFRSRLPALQPFRLSVDTSGFFEAGRKLGLGSSAALTVALVAALSRMSGQKFRAADALAAHTAKQSGRGSGADIVLCAGGGIRILQAAEAGSVNDPIPWPRQLHYAVIDTGVPASTPALLDTFADWRERASEADRMLQQLVACAAGCAAAWRSGNGPAVIAAISEYSERLHAMDTASGIGIFSGGHNDLGELAALDRLAYKPSGAGGGDFGIAFGSDVERLADFERRATEAGFSPVKIEYSEAGAIAQ